MQLLNEIKKLDKLQKSLLGVSKDLKLDNKWQNILQIETKKLYNSDNEINIKNLKNFRRNQIFISELGPTTPYSNLSPFFWWRDFITNPLTGIQLYLKTHLTGWGHGTRKILIETYNRVVKNGANELLNKYGICGTPGNPNVFHYKKQSFNLRWLRHIYFINLIKQYLNQTVINKKPFICLDIGSSYGIFSHLFKSEYPNSKHILVDFPEQLILAFYYLGTLFPELKIATLIDFHNIKHIDYKFIEKYDFILLPVTCFERLNSLTVDMVTNFFSFGEMKRNWFEKYVKSSVFKNAEYLMTSNRFVSAPRYEPTYDSDLTVMDYPFDDYDTILFDVNPVYPFYTKSKHTFFFEKHFFSSQYFDFIGRRLKQR